ncbi:unnamed protein product [Heterobilharzia americana]|nr:unnamed protein product [Heterobilharzia americana]
MNSDRINEKEFKQLCRLLQIQTDVTIHDLRKAYFRLARSCHPDKNPNNELATTHFILVSRAYQTLCSQLDWNRTRKPSEFSTKGKKCSIVEQFLSDLKRQDIEWPKLNKLYNENPSHCLPIDKLLNHLLEATLLTENITKTQTSEQSQTLIPSGNSVNSGISRSKTSPCTRKQSFDKRKIQLKDNVIVPYCDDNQQVVEKTHSQLSRNEDSFIPIKTSDLNEWINETQNLLDNIKSTRRLGHHSCTPCLNIRRCSDIENSNLLPVIDNPDMMRCLTCYRTFKQDVATKHVEVCRRKSQINEDGTNSLGSTVATGYSPVLFRAKQEISCLFSVK